MNHDLDAHIATITGVYPRQRDAMVRAIESHFPAEVTRGLSPLRRAPPRPGNY